MNTRNPLMNRLAIGLLGCLGLRRDDRHLHAESKALRSLQADRADWAVFTFLYENLSILDSKSTSLLQFNALILAVITIIVSSVSAGPPWSWLLFALLPGIVSSFCCLIVVWVQWTPAQSLIHDGDYDVRLLRLRCIRTCWYRVAWCFAILSLLALAIIITLVFHAFSK